jgi:hypothetical protein
MKVTICSNCSARNKGTILFHPIRGQKSRPRGLLDGTSDLIGTIEIVHLERNDRHYVGFAKEALCIRKTGERHARVVLVKARMKNAGYSIPLKLRYQSKRREFSLRAGHQHGTTHFGIDGVRQVVPDDNRRRGLGLAAIWVSLWLRIKRSSAAQRHVGQQIAHAAFLVRDDALNQHATGPSTARDEDLLVQPGRSRPDVGQLLEPRSQRTPVADAIARNPHQLHVSRGAQQPVLQIATHAIGDGQGNDQGRDTRRHTDDGNHGNYAHDRLAALRPQVAHGDKKFEAHRAQRRTVFAALTLSYRS